jgi:hypothetical protein
VRPLHQLAVNLTMPPRALNKVAHANARVAQREVATFRRQLVHAGIAYAFGLSTGRYGFSLGLIEIADLASVEFGENTGQHRNEALAVALDVRELIGLVDRLRDERRGRGAQTPILVRTRPASRRRLAANNPGPRADTMIDAYIKLLRLLALSALDAPEPVTLALSMLPTY